VRIVAEHAGETEWSYAVRMIEDEAGRMSLLRETASRPDVVGLEHMCALDE